MTNPKPKVIISKCIEFAPCRWNGVIIPSPMVEKLKAFVDFTPVCPEVEIGLGIPRKPIRLVETEGQIRLLQPETGTDVTRKMVSFVDTFLGKLDIEEIDGFILKDRSPSCGNKDVKVYPPVEKSPPLTTKGSGLYGGEVVKRYPHLAVENEGRLNNFRLREHFLTKLFAHFRLRQMIKKQSMQDLVDFHSAHKYLFMAYNQEQMRALGKITANHSKRPVTEVLEKYKTAFPQVFEKVPKFTSHINVLMHGLGYFSEKLTAQEKGYFLDTLEQYRKNVIPLSACSAVLKSWIVRFEEEYLARQVYFTPYPPELVEITDSGKGRG